MDLTREPGRKRTESAFRNRTTALFTVHPVRSWMYEFSMGVGPHGIDHFLDFHAVSYIIRIAANGGRENLTVCNYLEVEVAGSGRGIV